MQRIILSCVLIYQNNEIYIDQITLYSAKTAKSISANHAIIKKFLSNSLLVRILTNYQDKFYEFSQLILIFAWKGNAVFQISNSDLRGNKLS